MSQAGRWGVGATEGFRVRRGRKMRGLLGKSFLFFVPVYIAEPPKFLVFYIPATLVTFCLIFFF